MWYMNAILRSQQLSSEQISRWWWPSLLPQMIPPIVEGDWGVNLSQKTMVRAFIHILLTVTPDELAWPQFKILKTFVHVSAFFHDVSCHNFTFFVMRLFFRPFGLLIRLCHTTSSWKGLSNMTLRIKSHWPLGLLPSSIHNIRTRPSTSSVICRTKCTTILASNVWWSLPCRRRPWDSSCQRLQKGHFAWRCVRSLFCWIV